MKTYFIEKETKYTGAELSPHWIYRNFNILGDAIVAFIGEVEVKLTEMVDIEDVINNEPIYSKKMLNFIIERFEVPLEQMVWTQRLFVSIIKETLESRGAKVSRHGDDLFFDGRKLSVSIATKASTSCLIHTALNIIKEGAPVAASDLSELGIDDVEDFAREIMLRFKTETEDIKLAVCKVRGLV